MSIFQKSVLKNTSQNESIIALRWAEYQKYLSKIDFVKKVKEEKYQDGFLKDVFENCLGYVLDSTDPSNFNLEREKKNETDSKKADGVIYVNNKIVGIIELKAQDTKNLDKIEIQAFNYHNSHTNSKYIIISNFDELRFYIDKKTAYEKFSLFNLNYEEFNKLHLMLSYESIKEDVPLKLKEKSATFEKKISEELYKDFSTFRNHLYENVIKNNPSIEKSILLRLTQKLCDRIIFILFAEDRGLLTANTIKEIREEFQNQRFTDYGLYDIYKFYFKAINNGDNKLKIPKYNGGLFTDDVILDNLIIDDSILDMEAQKLSDYDFQSEISVNILGHIFEQSLTDLEEIQSKINNTAFDKSKSKRKKDGVFYTPEYITKYIVDNTLGELCNDRKKDLKSKKDYEEYLQWLLNLKILDPSCGSGAFLNQAFNTLKYEYTSTINHINEFTKEEHLKTADKKGQVRLFGAKKNKQYEYFETIEADIAILENNLYGVDINEDAVEIAKLSLWLRTAKKGRSLTKLADKIKCGNSLISDKDVVDDAFVWEEEFKEVFEQGGFDVVIGNPPYVFARENMEQKIKDYYSQSYISAQYQVNTYLLFIEKSIKIIKNKGLYGLIVPNAWLMVFSGGNLRKYILDTSKLNQIINLEGYSFDNVNVETIILLAKKENVINNECKIFLSKDTEFVFSHKKEQYDFTKNNSYEFRVFSDDISFNIIRKLQNNSILLDDIVQIKSGLKAYEKNKGIPKQTAEDVKNRPYDYDYKFDKNTFKYLDGKNVGRYVMSWSGLYLKYGKHLASPRTFNLFDGKKIIIREITGKYPKSIIATYNEEVYLYNMSNIAIVENENKNISLKYIVSILNSSLMAYYFIKNTAKSIRKMFPKVILKDLRQFPFKEINSEKQEPFIQKANIMLDLNKKLQETKQNFIAELELEKIPKKLQNFEELDFEEFIKEILKAKKAKFKDKLEERNFKTEWVRLFENDKKLALDLKDKIYTTDKDINKMVYKLYDLNNDDINIIENE